MIIIGEWMVEDYLRNVPIRPDVKKSVLSFLNGGYLASGGKVGSLFRLMHRHTTYFEPLAEVSIKGGRKTVILEVMSLDLTDTLDDRVIEVIREFTIDEVGKPYDFYRNEMAVGITYILNRIAKHMSQIGGCVVVTCYDNSVLELD